jgi:hypothetical protein
MTLNEFYDKLSLAKSSYCPRLTSTGMIRLSWAELYPAYYCPITAVYWHVTGKYKSSCEVMLAGEALGLTDSDIESIMLAADNDDDTNEVRQELKRRLF